METPDVLPHCGDHPLLSEILQFSGSETGTMGSGCLGSKSTCAPYSRVTSHRLFNYISVLPWVDC